MADEKQNDDEFSEEEYTRTILPTEDDHDESDGSKYYRNILCKHCDTHVGRIKDNNQIQYAEYRFVCDNCGEPTVIEATPPEEPSE